jgi:AcrR family transcriptional regulator
MPVSSTPTRERIVEEAMRLFGEHGYRGTSVATIEAAAGLRPGSGGLYRHFLTKEAVLHEGIRRHLDRLAALRDIRDVLTPLGDARTELIVMARYVLTEIDREEELFRILVTEARNGPHILTDAVERLVGSTYVDFTEWIGRQCRGRRDLEGNRAVAAVGLGSLLWHRLQVVLFGATASAVDDEVFVSAWADMMMATTHRTSRGKGSGSRRG